jgi:hypothetical protein
MPGQLFDESDVCSGMKERSTEGVPQEVRRDLLGDASAETEFAKHFRHLITFQAARILPRGHEKSRMRIRAKPNESPNPFETTR